MNTALVVALAVAVALNVLLRRSNARNEVAFRDRLAGRAPVAHAVLVELARGREVGEGDLDAAAAELKANGNRVALHLWRRQCRDLKRRRRRLDERWSRPARRLAVVALPVADDRPLMRAARARERRPSGIRSSRRRRTQARSEDEPDPSAEAA